MTSPTQSQDQHSSHSIAQSLGVELPFLFNDLCLDSVPTELLLVGFEPDSYNGDAGHDSSLPLLFDRCEAQATIVSSLVSISV